MKKALSRFLGLFLILGLAMGLSGCSGTSKTPAQKTTLYWWRSREDANEDVLQEVIKNYEKQVGTVKIELVLKDPRTYEQELTEALAAHQTVKNAPDIISIKGEDLPKFVPLLAQAPDNLFDVKQTTKSKKTGETTTQYVQNLFEDVVAKSVIFNSDGKQLVYGLPMGIDNLAVYKNKKLFAKAAERVETTNKVEKNLSTAQVKEIKATLEGDIDTWQKLVAVIPYLRVADGANISQAAIALGTSLNVERSYDILQTIMMQNGTVMTSDGLDEATFNLSQTGTVAKRTPGEEALKFYLRFSDPNDPQTYTWNDKMPNSVDAFMQGQTAMMIHYASAYRYIINEAPTIKSSLDVIPMFQLVDPKVPTSQDKLKTYGRMWVEAVPSAKGDQKLQNAAWSFVYYITSKSGSKPYLQAMKIPSALRDVTSSAKFDVFDEQKKFSDTWYKGHRALEIDKLFIGMIDEVYTARRSLKDALDAAAAQTTAVLQASRSKWATAAPSPDEEETESGS